MKDKSSILMILLFAALHGFSCIACRTMGVEDEHALTLLTIAMTFVLCSRRGMKFIYLIAVVILVNVLAYLIGCALPKLLIPLMGENMWVNAISTTVTTLILGFSLEFGADILLKDVPAPEDRQFRQRWVVQFNDRIVPVKTEQIAYFFSENKSNYLVTFDGQKYLVDSTIDAIVSDLDPAKFFRINRGCILSLSCIDSAVKDAGRLVAEVHPATESSFVVTRSRVDDFIKWLG